MLAAGGAQDATTRPGASLRRGFWRIGLGSPYDVEQATFLFGLLPVLRHERFDILHVQEPTSALVVERARRLGYVRTRAVYGNGSKEPPEFLRKITYLHHLSPHYLNEARDAGTWKPTWTAIPNFVNADLFHPGRSEALRAELGIPQDALVVLTAAAIKRNHKRVDYLR